MTSLEETSRVHCVGIGGIGISAIAKLLVRQGKTVSGSDAQDSEIVREAAAAGVRIIIGHDQQHSQGADLVIYSEAIPRDNPERVQARELGILELSGAEALAELTKGQRLIAVAGTNGKSTTTALIGLLLEAGGFDPTVIVGSKVKNFPLGNLRVGQSNWFVLEADEYQAKFLHLQPEIIVITNIEEDHLDFYRDLNHIRETFQVFVDRLPQFGRCLLNADDEVSINDLAPPPNLVTYGLENPADYLARSLETRIGHQRFTVLRTKPRQENLGEFSLRIPGRFNVANALAALSLASELGISKDIGQAVLESFPGLWRRFEIIGERQGALIISDYGHHPTAIRETLRGAHEFYPDRRLVLIFQPHQSHRLRALFSDFVKSFVQADVLIISEIYAVRGRESEAKGTKAQDLARAVEETGQPSAVYFGGSLPETKKLLLSKIQPGDLLLFMGAGDIDSLARQIGSDA